MNMFRRIFFGVWCLLFILFAYWQWNDPDPWLWIPIYGGAAVLSAFAAAGSFSRPPLSVCIALCLAGFVYLYPSSASEWIQQEWQQQDLSMKTQNMEEGRESFGLLIIALVLSVALYFGWRSHLHRDRSQKSGNLDTHKASVSTKTESGRRARV